MKEAQYFNNENLALFGKANDSNEKLKKRRWTTLLKLKHPNLFR